MKKFYSILITLSLVFLLGRAQAQYLRYDPIVRPASLISDGWYNATVLYTNYSTNYKAKYTLKVKVERGFVVAIQFSDGQLHSGYNSSGYSWSGGYLEYEKDRQGEITSAITTIKILDKDTTTKVYTIYI